MSYLVLARKWRPRRFAELVGQTHVVRALTNALASGRVHHAFLFSGTRGVGKTTIARIFAKSLNCERGQGAEPCGTCATCLDIDDGRFVDLLEIDAASNTGVDDVRQLIENAQYMPSRGRTKVYLIDEVHMLSKSAFNALLKTLEEPPPHVKFLLATTDPDKLPVTVLSRCLQFNLKRLDEAQIRAQMEKILAAEELPYDGAALALLAHGADGSLRDGLSLLDQAIAYTAGTLDEAGVRAMLGTVDRARIGAMLDALAAGDGRALMDAIDALAGFSPDFGQVLDDVASALHQVQLQQLVPGVADAGHEAGVDVGALATALAPEIVQLWYQMAIGGRRDLAHAPSPRSGFEMAMLRMLAFRPARGVVDAASESAARPAAPPRTAVRSAAPTPPAAPVAATRTSDRDASIAPRTPTPVRDTANAAMDRAPAREAAMPGRVQHVPSVEQPPPAAPAVEAVASAQPPRAAMPLCTPDDWLALVDAAQLKGPTRDLASHATLVSHADGALTLAVPPGLDHMHTDAMTRKLAEALAPALGAAPRIVFVASDAAGDDNLHARNARQRDERQVQAERAFLENPSVQRYMQQYGAKLVPDSIRPEEN